MSDPEETGKPAVPCAPASETPAASTDPASPASSPPVVADSQAAAARAQAAAGQALADPQADLNRLLDALRTIEVQLYGIEVVQQVQPLPDEERQAFVAARLHLTSVINQLNTAQLSNIADQLEQQSSELRQGIQALQKSLGTLTGAAGWASAINGVIGIIGKVIPLL